MRTIGWLPVHEWDGANYAGYKWEFLRSRDYSSVPFERRLERFGRMVRYGCFHWNAP